MKNLRFISRMTEGVKILIMINCGTFLLTSIVDLGLFSSHQNQILSTYSLIPQHILEGKIWQIFTYQFLHGGILHLFANMFTLWMIGPELEKKWSTKFFIKYYFICATGAGVFIFALPIILGQSLLLSTLGASGAIFGLLLAYAVYWPDRMILIWFVIPIKVKYFAIIMGFISLFFTFQTSGGGGISHIAHLGGLITGYIYLMYKIPQLIDGLPSYTRISKFKGLKRIFSKYLVTKKNQEWVDRQKEIDSEVDIEEKVDQLLEKISKHGWKSLSLKERNFLKKASENMDKS